MTHATDSLRFRFLQRPAALGAHARRRDEWNCRGGEGTRIGGAVLLHPTGLEGATGARA